MNAHINALILEVPIAPSAFVTTAINAALHAPLSKAVSIVKTIMPRQVRRINFNKIIISYFQTDGNFGAVG
jgi:hypothetical protein